MYQIATKILNTYSWSGTGYDRTPRTYEAVRIMLNSKYHLENIKI